MAELKNIYRILRSAAVASCIAAGSLAAAAFAPQIYADSSKLASVRWVKVRVSESGLYQITADDARRWGLSSDLSRLRVAGYGGAQLSERLSSDLPDDLPAVAVSRENNRIVFYAQGPVTWASGSGLTHLQSNNPYSTAGYYFVTDDATVADATVQRSANAVAAGTTVDWFTERLCHESDLDNPGETGRDFLGEDFRYTTTQSFQFSLPGLVDGSEVSVLTRFGAKVTDGSTSGGSGASLSFQYNGTNLSSSSSDQMSGVGSGDLGHVHYVPTSSLKTFTLSGTNSLTYTVNYKHQSSDVQYFARLDYITVNYRRSLALDGGKLSFGLSDASTAARYELSGAQSTTHIWDVTNVSVPVEMNATLSGTTAAFSPATGGRREFVAYNEGVTLPSPTLVGTVANQNLHGQPTPDMIIITPSEYATQAQRIASMHETTDSMRVLVVDKDLVYNEFSSGTPDAMAYRRLCKMFYDRGTDATGHKLGYLLLMGNGSYDNRQISDKIKLIAYPMLLTWQSSASSNENSSYTTDDVFGILDDNSGPAFASGKLRIAVGRFPVKSVAEARTAAEKLIKYVSQPDYGKWKLNVLNVADDEDSGVHMQQAENVVTTARSNGGGDYVYNHVYIDAFTSISTGAGRNYPDARKKMFNTLREGVVWWNYTGHANPNGWTGDGLLLRTDVEQNLYYDHLPILYAATCEFTRYDAAATSSGEEVFLNSRGGAVAVVCPPRLVYIPNNGSLNRAVAKYIFATDNGLPLRLGDIMLRGKNDIASEDNKLRYFLFGDPAMRPAYATERIVVDSINGHDVSTADPATMPVFKARQTITVDGHITNAAGKSRNDFNGTINTTLYDAEQSVTTHGYGEQGEEFTYQDRSNKLALSVDSVKNGKFSIKIVIPSEVVSNFDNYSPALLSLYADCPSDSTEAIGSNSNFYIYGTDDTVATDTIGPEIDVFGLNSEVFADGTSVNESPLVIAHVSDASGINVSSSGIGHGMLLTLDGTTSYSDVSTYYTPEAVATGSAGTIAYQLSDLAEGSHTLRLRVWDVFNNSSSRTISFNVVSGLKPEVYNLWTDACPAKEEANFYVRHNRPDATLQVTLSIYDLMGREVWSSTQSGRSDMFRSFPITWNLCDGSGSRVPRGIYVCRASVSTDGVQETTKAVKVAVAGE